MVAELTGVEVRLLPPDEQRRIPYQVNRGSGYSNPDHRWRWCCPVCDFTCEDREHKVAQRQADAHSCDAGWCALPMGAR